MQRREFLQLAGATLAAGFSTRAAAQTWPERTVKVILPYAPGGATDAIGLKATENPVHFRDLHATLLYQMGLDQDALSYMYLGRKERLTEVRGEIIVKSED